MSPGLQSPANRDVRELFERKPLSRNPVIAELDIERNELAQTWKTFVDHLPPADRLEGEQWSPTAPNVVALVRNIQSVWMSHPRQRVFGQCMALCDRLIPTLDTHFTLLSLLPESELYSLSFYGALQSVIKASANYPRVMEGLIAVLLNFHDALGFPKDNHLPPSDAVAPIAEIYALIFFFLTEFMDWYVRRATCQLLKSHNQDVYFDFDHLVRHMQRRARHLPWQSEDAMDIDERGSKPSWGTSLYSSRDLWEAAHLSEVGLHGAGRRIAAQNTITRRLIWEIQQDAEERIRLREKQGKLLAQMLNSVSHQLQSVSEQSSGIVCMTTAAALNPDACQFQWSRGTKRRLSRLELQNASKHLQEYFDSDDQIADFEPDVEVVAEGSVVASLRQWATSPRSQALAVGGSQPTVFPSPVALISACYASVARQARLPVISHFCALPTQAAPGLTLHEQGLIALTYSLIRQLVDCLPAVVDSDAVLDLSAERFRQLTGTLTTWKAALSLIDTLLHFAPPLLVCVIDGLHAIHDTPTDLPLRELVRLLVTHTRHQSMAMPNGSRRPSILFKVLFTVNGRPSALVETLSENHLILSESNQTDEPATAEAVLTSDLGVVMMNA